MKTKAICGCALALALAVGLSAVPARAHGDGVLRLARARATAGLELPVSGQEFSASTVFRLVLKGALREYELTTVESDAQGTFNLDLRIPATVQPGSYRLVAVAPDDDDAATVDLEVEAASAESEAAGAAAAETPMASADALVIERRRSGIEWFVRDRHAVRRRPCRGDPAPPEAKAAGLEGVGAFSPTACPPLSGRCTP